MNPFSATENLRKAAILVASLDSDQAAAVYATLDSRDAEQLRQAAAALEEIDPQEQRTIVAEFLSRAAPAPDDPSLGVELDGDLARRLADFNDQAHASFDGGGTAAIPLAQVSPLALYQALRHEHQQTIAVVLARLPAERAAALLRHWPLADQPSLLDRVTLLTPTEHELWHELEQALLARIAENQATAAVERQRQAAVAAILYAAEEPVRAAWRDRPTHSISAVRASDALSSAEFQNDRQAIPRGDLAATAEELPADERSAPASPLALASRGAPADFEPSPGSLAWRQVCDLEDDALAAVLSAASADCLQLALAGADATFLARLRRHLGPQAARHLDRGLHRLGPIRVGEIVEAQRRIGELAGQVLAQLRSVPRRRASNAS